MIEWHDIKLIAAVCAGIVLSLLLSTATTFKGRLTCVFSGLFFAFFGTEPLVQWAGHVFASSGWPYLIAGALAMTGDRLARRLIQFADNGTLPGNKRS